MKILAIETSCDETSLALLEASGGLSRPRFKILKNLIASQIKIHQPFGGVVPNLAKREHTKNLPILFRKIFGNPKSEIRNPKQILKQKFKIQNIDLIAATVGPGLEPCLWTGITFAKQIYQQLTTNNQQPTTKLIGVNHLNGHLYSYLLNLKSYALFPAIALIVSGGHTILLLMKDLKTYKKLGETRDDAVGEAFDKVARLLNLPYPGGPELERLARSGNPEAINFPRPMINQKNYHFSFSGLKTAVLYYLRDNFPRQSAPARQSFRRKFRRVNPRRSAAAADVAASFQKAAFDVLISKTMRAVREFNAKTIIVSGGVAANRELRGRFRQELSKISAAGGKNKKSKIRLIIPKKELCTDNAAMIAVAGYIGHLCKKRNKLTARGDLNI